MHRTIVVGVDGSDASEAALTLAQELLDPAGRIVLAAVFARYCGLSRPSSGYFYVDTLREQGAQHLEEADIRLDPGVRRERHLLADVSVPRALHDLAERVEADLIVLGAGRHRAALEALGEGLDVDVAVLEGDPVRELVLRSQELDLLVCGSRAYGPATAVLAGGTSRALMHRAACPVLVVPRTGVVAAWEVAFADGLRPGGA